MTITRAVIDALDNGYLIVWMQPTTEPVIRIVENFEGVVSQLRDLFKLPVTDSDGVSTVAPSDETPSDNASTAAPADDWFDRLKVEYRELSVKITKLKGFFGTEEAKRLDPVDKLLLAEQYDYMRMYRDVLNLRLDRAVLAQK